MDYFKILEFKNEPFSNSPDPDFFFLSTQHRTCLQRLEISLRLKRGLNVVVGDVGTGKTTLCRELIRKLSMDESFETHLLLDPGFRSPEDFIVTVFELFKIQPHSPVKDIPDLKEEIKHHILKRGVEEKKNIVLIIDEGQKIPGSCLEILREFLNFETNAHKLLQIVIFAQKEFRDLTAPHANFTDRISLFHGLAPLSFFDTHAMIHYRLKQSATTEEGVRIFTLPAVFLIYRISGGFPRKIINLCHQALLTMIIQNRARVDWFCIKTVRQRIFINRPPERKRGFSPALFLLLLICASLFFLPSHRNLSAGLNALMPSGFSRVWGEKQSEAPLDPKLPVRKAVTEDSTKINGQQDSEKNRGQNGAPPVRKPLNKTATIKEQPRGEEGKRDLKGMPHIIKTASKTPTIEDLPQGDEGNRDPAGIPSIPGMPGKSSAEQPEKIPVKRSLATRSKAAYLKTLKSTPQVQLKRDVTAEIPGTPPQVFGKVEMGRNETLGWLIRVVYGEYSDTLLHAVLNSSEQIFDVDQVQEGQSITFPSAFLNYRQPPEKCIWIALGEAGSLEKAVDMVRGHPRRRYPVRLIPHWTKEAGLNYTLVLREYFIDTDSAEKVKASLPAGIGKAAGIISAWPDNTCFFTPKR